MVIRTKSNGHDIEEGWLNIAAIHPGTRALGPGKRAAIWVQGCPFSCPGCIAPEWTENKKAFAIHSHQLAHWVAGINDIQGLTISGGEPMLQAQALHCMVELLRSLRDVDIICFTGYRLEKLLTSPPAPGVIDLINNLDVLIDGLYVQSMNHNTGLRGSTNQKIHYLTRRLREYDFENSPRTIELTLQEDYSTLVGIPTLPFLKAYDQSLKRIQGTNQPVNPPGQSPRSALIEFKSQSNRQEVNHEWAQTRNS